jgi:hypothetical protein
MKYTSNTLFIFVFAGLLTLSGLYFFLQQQYYASVTSYDECRKVRFHVLTTYPEQCKIPGKVFPNPKTKDTLQKNEVMNSSNTIPKDGELFKSSAYFINGTQVIFNNGSALYEVSSNKERYTARYNIMGGELHHDINDDGKPDVVILIKESDSTSSTTRGYYITSALSLNNGYVGTNTFLLGKDYASSSLTFKNGSVALIYNDSSSAQKTRYFTIKNGILKEIQQRTQ